MSIFDEGNKIKSQYWKYPNIGDKIDGTYIERRVTTNRLKADAEQIVYTLKLTNGEIWDVYGKAGIDAQMRNVGLGQVIGFEFTEEIPPTVPGHNATKVVQVYANPSIVDEDWLKGNKELSADEIIDAATSTPAVENAPAAPAEKTAPVAEAVPSATGDLEAVIKEINNLAIEKLKATTPEDVKAKAMEATGLAFIEGNLPQILEALKALPVK